MPVQIPDIPHAYRVDSPQDTKWHEVHIAPDGQTVYVHQHTLMVDLVSTLIDATQTLLFFAILMIGLWAIVYLIRHRRELRKSGVPSCCRCHYDLTGIIAVEEVSRGKRTRFQATGEPTRPTCPECGVNLKARKPLVGQKLQRVLWSPEMNTKVTAVLISFYALIIIGWLVKPNLSWLSESAGAWANRQPIKPIRNAARPRDVLSTIDPATGAIHQRITSESRYSSAGRLSPDGRSWIRFANESYRSGYLVCTPIQPGGHALARHISIGRSFNRAKRILAFKNQGDAALIVGTDNKDYERFIEIDLKSGRLREHFSRKVRNAIHQGMWYADQADDPKYFVRYARDSSHPIEGREYEIFPWNNALQPGRTVIIRDREASLRMMGIGDRNTLAIKRNTDEIIAIPANRSHALARIDRETGALHAAVQAVGTGRGSRNEIQLAWQDDRLIFLTAPDDNTIFVYDLIHDQWIARLTHPQDISIRSLAVNPNASHIHAVGDFMTTSTGAILPRWPHGIGTALLAWDTTPIREALERLDHGQPAATEP